VFFIAPRYYENIAGDMEDNVECPPQHEELEAGLTSRRNEKKGCVVIECEWYSSE
jgi:hypothetical protein